MPLEELIMCFLLVNASLNKISVLVTGACQSLVHFSFTHPFYVRTVYKRVLGTLLVTAATDHEAGEYNGLFGLAGSPESLWLGRLPGEAPG